MGKLVPYFAFRGRVNRLRYWLTSLALYGLLFVALALGAVPVVGILLIGLALVTFMWAALAVSARRMHDRGKSAWWLVAMYLPVVLLSGLGLLAELGGGATEDAASVLNLLSLPFSIWALVELGILKGTSGPNRFGPDPLAPTNAEVFA